MELVLYAARSPSPRTYALVVVASLSLSFMFALVASTANGLYATLERAVFAWNCTERRFVGFVPGVSPPERDFPVEFGRGYFLYLEEESVFVEVGRW